MTEHDTPGHAPHLFNAERLTRARAEISARTDLETGAELTQWLDAVLELETRSHTNTASRDQVYAAFRTCLRKARITSGRIAELGGPFNSKPEAFPEFDWEWLSLYPVKGREAVRVCNICEADHIESERYDAIFSVSVMEHVAEPWKAAEHMLRMLKPGGIIFHNAPFSYFYHGAPSDFWRFTPDGFSVLFPSLRPMMGEFDGGGRRRDNRGTAQNRVDRDGGKDFAVDAYGGWRENWSATYCGMKSTRWAWQKRKDTEKQFAVDLMRQYVKRGLKLHEAARIVVDGLRLMELDARYDLQLCAKGGKGITFGRKTCVELYRNRHTEGPAISYNTYAAICRFEHLLEQHAQRS